MGNGNKSVLIGGSVIVEEFVSKLADSAMSVVILSYWLYWLTKQNKSLQTRLDSCLTRFESHLESHEKE